jgi:hypothetical protein
MNGYELRQELRDATLCDPFYRVSSKRLACSLAKKCVATSGHDVVAVSVWDVASELAVFTAKKEVL